MGTFYSATAALIAVLAGLMVQVQSDVLLADTAGGRKLFPGRRSPGLRLWRRLMACSLLEPPRYLSHLRCCHDDLSLHMIACEGKQAVTRQK
jgi:hypothetical protein